MSKEKNKENEEKCLSCEGFVLAYTENEAAEKLKDLSKDWLLIEEGKAIEKKMSFKNFKQVMIYMGGLAHLAEREKHHPDVSLGYNYCHVKLTTHSVSGLTPNDFILGKMIDKL